MLEIARISTQTLNDQGFMLEEKHLQQSLSIHWHEFYKIEYFIDGQGMVLINQKPYDICPGVLLFVTPLDFVEIPHCTGGRVIDLGFSDILLYPDVLTTLSSCVVLTDYQPHLLFQLQKELKKWDRRSAFMVQHLLNCLVIDIIRQIPESKQNAAGSTRGLIIRKAVRFINEHFHERLTLQDVSRHVGLSANYFSFLFRQKMGMTFKAYLTSQRLKYAGNELALSELPISDICFAAGFNNYAHFSRIFRKYYYMSPSEYRLKNSGAWMETS